jgi:hypothetical protein
MLEIEALQLGLIRQNFPSSRRPNIPDLLAAEFKRAGFAEKIRPGQRVLITSGGRSLEYILEVVRELAGLVRRCGARPLILPAMGAHGGGSPQGQVETLALLGQTEDTLGAPIYDQSRPVQIGQVFDGIPVYVDQAALPGQTDHVILAAQIAEHTDFPGPIESGLLKMAVTGLGRTAGTRSLHQALVGRAYDESVLAMARVVFQATPILGGIALVEDQRNILRRLEALTAEEIERREPELLVLSRSLKPKLPFKRLDALLVDEMGKDISDSGLDPKVIGRFTNIYTPESIAPAITRIITLKMSARSGGNAIGLGLSDFVTFELLEHMDRETTELDAVTSAAPEKARCPIARATPRDVLTMALKTVGPWTPETLTLAWILNTRDLEYLAVSPALWRQAAYQPALTRLSPPRRMPFDAQGRLPAFDSFREDCFRPSQES